MIEFELGELSIKISEEVFEIMKSFIQDENHKPEAGGILIGHYLEDNNYSITDVSSPSELDKSSRFNFTRSKKNAQKIINKIFKDSKGKKIYLGEWHTHPEHHPSPSATDLNEWHKICRQRQTPMVFLIVGWSGELWLGLSGGVEIERCMLVSA